MLFNLMPLTDSQTLLQRRMDEQLTLLREHLEYANFIYPATLAYLESLLLATEFTSGENSFDTAIVLDRLIDTQHNGAHYIREVSYLENTRLHLRLLRLCRENPGPNKHNLRAAYRIMLSNRIRWGRETGTDVYANALLNLKEQAFGQNSMPVAETLAHIVSRHTCSHSPNRKSARLEGEQLVPDYQRFAPYADRVLDICRTTLADMKAGRSVALGDVAPSWVSCALWNAIGSRKHIATQLSDTETEKRMDALYEERRLSSW